ncbi:CPBP family glutamic-type intramembrane protease [uncultured Ralstonia sp.]|jgi:membrane protease YdiL (CAAX protease family)|uniref:CPBP family glutamic-type intramembrane protease n=1 Tax=Ralstonia sp. TaxID=54061 RepID=UPI0025CDFD48|nr:CPBP family glutamic-type intramembrane protease [uncultured Ralstonia sp.]
MCQSVHAVRSRVRGLPLRLFEGLRRLRMTPALCRGIGVMLLLVGSLASAQNDVGPEPAGLSLDELKAPERSVEVVRNAEQSGYARVLAAYEQARREHADDVMLAVAQCGFIQRFAWSEESTWADVASTDLEACKATLERQHASRPEAQLYLLESRYGKAAVAYGEPLLARASTWAPEQRARLHAALSRAYAANKDEPRSGEQALLAVKFDPASDRLVPAMRYLVKVKRADEAAKLLGAAPVPKLAWQESTRIKAAAELLPANAARDELERARAAGLKIDAHTAARALRRAGDVAGAQALLAADSAFRANETGEMRQLRLDVAFDAGATKAVADALGDWVRKSGTSESLGYAYARLLRMDPLEALRMDLMPLVGWLLAFTAMLVLSPAVLLFPAHYRGTVRVRLGKPSEPLFARIGLRHAWFAFAVLAVALYLVPIILYGRDVGGGLPVAGPPLAEWSRQLAITQMWALGLGALGLVWVATRLSWREWLGSGRWKLRWFIPALCCLGLVAIGLASGRYGALANGADQRVTLVVAIISGAKALGGVPLALLLMSVLVPICEELVFRGCILGGLSRHLSFGWANFWQAVLFAAVHQDMRRAFFYFMLAIIAGLLVRRTKGLIAPILLHAANNALFVLALAG